MTARLLAGIRTTPMRVSSGSANLHVETLGDAGAAVLLLHGLGGSSATWCDIPSALARSRRVMLPDLRGCGASERGVESYTFEVLARDVVAVLDALRVANCHLIGHSLGGVVAQHVLTTYPERCASAVLVSTSSRVGKRASEAWRRLGESVRARGLNDQAQAVKAGFSAEFAIARPDVVRALAEVANASAAATFAEQANMAARYDYTDALGAVTVPVLLVQGEADQLTPPRGSELLQRACPRARLEVVPGAGHNVHLEMGSAFVELVERFFADVEKAAVAS